MKKLIFFSLVLLIAACGSDTTSGSGTEGSGSSTGPAAGGERAMVSILTAEGNTLGYVSSGHSIRIGEGAEILSRMKGDKRKYDVPGGAPLKVTYKEDGFKVKKEDGELLWKIKTYDDKIKISDNEENENPYEIKFYDGKRAKLKFQEQELGEVELDNEGHQTVKGSGKEFAIGTDQFSGSYAALLIDRIPLEQRLIIVSELLAMGK
jgi:hypothetical protein